MRAEDQLAMLRAICRKSINAFTQKAVSIVSPGTAYQHNWHIDAISWHLEQVINGHIKRLIITMPPRSLKSICSSVALPAFLLGRDPAARIIAVSYSQYLADKHARDCRALMESRFYQQLFPGTILDRRKSSVAEFTTRRKGFRLATSLGGTLTGRGGDIIILDDPMKPEDALSETIRAKGIDWFSNTLLSRLDDKDNGAIIIVMQRLHEDDLAGHLLAQPTSSDAPGWHHFNLPAICEEPEDIPTGDNMSYVRTAGEPLHAARESLTALNRLKTDMGSYDFAAQYQQNPAPRGGGLVKLYWFRKYTAPFISQPSDIVVQSWDTAMSAASGADYSVCTSWAIRKHRQKYTYYLIDVFRKQLSYPGLQRQIQRQSDIHAPKHILIEHKSSGISLIQDLAYRTSLPIKKIEPKHDKVTRMQVATPPIENGCVFIPDNANWLDSYELELSRFPRARHDDQVDSTSQFISWAETKYMKNANRPMGFIIYNDPYTKPYVF